MYSCFAETLKGKDEDRMLLWLSSSTIYVPAADNVLFKNI